MNSNDFKLRPYLKKQGIQFINRVENAKEQYHYPVTYLNKILKKTLNLMNSVEEIDENKITEFLKENRKFENYEKRQKHSICNIFSETPLSSLRKNIITTIQVPFEEQKYQELGSFTKKRSQLLENSDIENKIKLLIEQIDKSNLPVSQRINILDATVTLIEKRNNKDIQQHVLKYKNFAEELALSNNNSIWCCMFSSPIAYTCSMKEIAKTILEFNEKNMTSQFEIIELNYK